MNGVTLALGSGGARGLAHIGVIRVLEEEGIPIQAIAGSSIGALVGGIYACGSLDRFEDFVRGLDWQAVVWFMDPVLPRSGFFGAKRVEKLVVEMVGDAEIQDLNIPFAIIAADLQTGRKVVLEEGPICPALRASYAIPGVITPFRVSDRWLVDGGVVSPVPVAVADTLLEGQFPTLAIDLHAASFGPGPLATAPPAPKDPAKESELKRKAKELLQSMDSRLGVTHRASKVWQRLDRAPKDRAPNIIEILSESTSLSQARISEWELRESAPEILLTPRLPKVSLFDFYRAEDLIAEGRRCAQEALADGRLKVAIEGRPGRLGGWLRERQRKANRPAG